MPLLTWYNSSVKVWGAADLKSAELLHFLLNAS
nr:MAG TPA: hypothetical protein [Caudoviricetes sp.]